MCHEHKHAKYKYAYTWDKCIRLQSLHGFSAVASREHSTVSNYCFLKLLLLSFFVWEIFAEIVEIDVKSGRLDVKYFTKVFRSGFFET